MLAGSVSSDAVTHDLGMQNVSYARYVLVVLASMHKTGCSGDLSCKHLAHHELESFQIIV